MPHERSLEIKQSLQKDAKKSHSNNDRDSKFREGLTKNVIIINFWMKVKLLAKLTLPAKPVNPLVCYTRLPSWMH